jgi:hypothetical protein
MHWGRQRSPGICQTHIRPLDCQMVKHDSSHQRTCFHCLCAAARPFLVLTLLPEAVWNSGVSVAMENRQFLCATHFSTQWSHSVSLCVLPPCGWAVVSPRCFHFTITALTVDRGSSSRAKMRWTDLLERWHPMMVPCWKSLSSSLRPFYCQILSMEIAWPVLDVIHLSATGVVEIAESTHLKWCPHTFAYIV